MIDGSTAAAEIPDSKETNRAKNLILGVSLKTAVLCLLLYFLLRASGGQIIAFLLGAASYLFLGLLFVVFAFILRRGMAIYQSHENGWLNEGSAGDWK